MVHGRGLQCFCWLSLMALLLLWFSSSDVSLESDWLPLNKQERKTWNKNTAFMFSFSPKTNAFPSLSSPHFHFAAVGLPSGSSDFPIPNPICSKTHVASITARQRTSVETNTDDFTKQNQQTLALWCLTTVRLCPDMVIFLFFTLFCNGRVKLKR